MSSISSLTTQFVGALFGNQRRNDIASTLTSIAFGQVEEAAPAPVGPGQAVAALTNANAERERELAIISSRPTVQRTLDRFESAVRNASSVEELLSDRDALTVILTASGLDDLLDSPALLQRALTSDRTDETSLINQLARTNIPLANLANRLQLDTAGLAVVQDESTIEAFRGDYLGTLRLQELGRTTPGLDRALQFQERAPQVTRAIEVLGDPVLREVALTVLGLPREIALQPLETQERLIDRGLDIERLQDPDYVEGLARRFLIARNGLDPTAQFSA
ncbi:MAG: DUF1217 domain-containing protein [Hyphomonadaceae bacterium]|nr:DUF1217 domain-containing protein [Hyphomonadaceae bacterium]